MNLRFSFFISYVSGPETRKKRCSLEILERVLYKQTFWDGSPMYVDVFELFV